MNRPPPGVYRRPGWAAPAVKSPCTRRPSPLFWRNLAEELERPTLKASPNEAAQMAMTYNFKIVEEPDEDFDGNPAGWHAYCPVLERQGASTWGETQDEALKNINELVRMVVESMLEHGERIPEEPPTKLRLPSSPALQ
jgi:predicted RNase H-like HicB family nuclease